ncbi:MAG: hypothetical protein KGL39_31165 [Patescibacteria group bacterium]|nr:hypothetical protein [Patescibacteria group bacterium]
MTGASIKVQYCRCEWGHVRVKATLIRHRDGTYTTYRQQINAPAKDAYGDVAWQ